MHLFEKMLWPGTAVAFFWRERPGKATALMVTCVGICVFTAIYSVLNPYGDYMLYNEDALARHSTSCSFDRIETISRALHDFDPLGSTLKNGENVTTIFIYLQCPELHPDARYSLCDMARYPNTDAYLPYCHVMPVVFPGSRLLLERWQRLGYAETFWCMDASIDLATEGERAMQDCKWSVSEPPYVNEGRPNPWPLAILLFSPVFFIGVIVIQIAIVLDDQWRIVRFGGNKDTYV